MRGLIAWTHIADNSRDVFDGCCRRPDAKNAFDLVQLFVHRRVAVTSNKDDCMDVFQEGWLPIWFEGISSGGTLVPQVDGVCFLSGLEILVVVEV